MVEKYSLTNWDGKLDESWDSNSNYITEMISDNDRAYWIIDPKEVIEDGEGIRERFYTFKHDGWEIAGTVDIGQYAWVHSFRAVHSERGAV